MMLLFIEGAEVLPKLLVLVILLTALLLRLSMCMTTRFVRTPTPTGTATPRVGGVAVGASTVAAGTAASPMLFARAAANVQETGRRRTGAKWPEPHPWCTAA